MNKIREDFATAVTHIKPVTGVEVQTPTPEPEKPTLGEGRGFRTEVHVKQTRYRWIASEGLMDRVNFMVVRDPTPPKSTGLLLTYTTKTSISPESTVITPEQKGYLEKNAVVFYRGQGTKGHIYYVLGRTESGVKKITTRFRNWVKQASDMSVSGLSKSDGVFMRGVSELLVRDGSKWD